MHLKLLVNTIEVYYILMHIALGSCINALPILGQHSKHLSCILKQTITKAIVVPRTVSKSNN